MTTTLAGEVALVTGGSRGLGAASPEAISAQGEEVAATVCFLAGPDAGYIGGGVVDVAGGFQI